MKRRLLVAALMLASFVVGAAGTPPPPPPQSGRSFLSISEDYPDDTSCPFIVNIKTTGSGWMHTLYYPNGSPKQQLLTQMSTRTTFTNASNGKSLSSPSSNMVQVRMAPDGTITFMAARGLVWRVVVPGEGMVAVDFGDVIIDVRLNQGKVQADVVKPNDKSFTIQKLCPYLD